MTLKLLNFERLVLKRFSQKLEKLSPPSWIDPIKAEDNTFSIVLYLNHFEKKVEETFSHFVQKDKKRFNMQIFFLVTAYLKTHCALSICSPLSLSQIPFLYILTALFSLFLISKPSTLSLTPLSMPTLSLSILTTSSSVTYLASFSLHSHYSPCSISFSPFSRLHSVSSQPFTFSLNLSFLSQFKNKFEFQL